MQRPRQEGLVIARVSGEPASYLPAIRREVGGMDGSLPLFDVRTMTARARDASWRSRFAMSLVSLFAAVALVLAGIGIYGVVSHSVERRAHEIEITIALGASPARVLRSVFGRTLSMAAGGIVLGAVGAGGATRVLAALPYGTSPRDPIAFGAAGLVLLAVALAAGYVPARRAGTVDPVVALRAE